MKPTDKRFNIEVYLDAQKIAIRQSEGNKLIAEIHLKSAKIKDHPDDVEALARAVLTFAGHDSRDAVFPVIAYDYED